MPYRKTLTPTPRNMAECDICGRKQTADADIIAATWGWRVLPEPEEEPDEGEIVEEAHFVCPRCQTDEERAAMGNPRPAPDPAA